MKNKKEVLESIKLLSFPENGSMIAQEKVIGVWIEDLIKNFLEVKATVPPDGGFLQLRLRWYPDGSWCEGQAEEK